MLEIAGFALFLLFAFAVLILLLTVRLVRASRRPPRHTAGYAVAYGMACDPVEAGLSCESWSIEREGCELPVWEVAGAGAAGAAVFVHGWGHGRVDTLDRMLAQRDLWMPRFRSLVFFELRGHGDAGGASAVSRLGADEDADLLAIVDRLPAGPVVLVGHSMGAVIAINAAAAAGERIAGVIAHAPYDSLRASLRARLAFAGLPARPMTDLALLWFRLIGLRHGTTSRAAARLACPLLVLHGTDDPISAPDAGRRIAESAARGRYEPFEGVGHTGLHLADPERHGRVVAEWLDEVIP